MQGVNEFLSKHIRLDQVRPLVAGEREKRTRHFLKLLALLIALRQRRGEHPAVHVRRDHDATALEVLADTRFHAADKRVVQLHRCAGVPRVSAATGKIKRAFGEVDAGARLREARVAISGGAAEFAFRSVALDRAVGKGSEFLAHRHAALVGGRQVAEHFLGQRPGNVADAMANPPLGITPEFQQPGHAGVRELALLDRRHGFVVLRRDRRHACVKRVDVRVVGAGLWLAALALHRALFGLGLPSP